jgi:hypothetical protein
MKMNKKFKKMKSAMKKTYGKKKATAKKKGMKA